MRMLRQARPLLVFLFFAVFLFKPAGAVIGEVGLNPFDAETAARPLAMGGAFVGLADDVNSQLYNPGGMAWSKGISLTMRDFDNITALQAYPNGSGSSIGFAVATNKISDIPYPGGTAYSNSSLILLSYGTKLFFIPQLYQNEAFQQIGVGLSVKALLADTLARSGQPDRSASGWNVDLGGLWKISDYWSAGAALENMLPPKFLNGGILRWDNGTEEALPATLKLGTAYKLVGDIGAPVFMEGRELNLCGEIDLADGTPTLLKMGGEWAIERTHFLRAGLMQQNRRGGVLTNLNLGYGWRSDNWGIDLTTYREPLRDENIFYLSVLYFPKEWIVIKKLDLEKPSVILEKPFVKFSLRDNFITYDSTLEVTGRAKPGVEIWVNGLRAALDAKNNFLVYVPLKPEKNLIMVEARCEGEKKFWKYKVLRQKRVVVSEEKEIEKELGSATARQREELKKKAEAVEKQRERVEVLTTLGVIEVTPEAEFKLEASIKRGELAAWLVKAAGIQLPKIDRDVFPDVKRDNPLAPYIKAAVDWDMLKPSADGNFYPEAPVSKEDGEKLFKIFGVKKSAIH